MVKNMGKIDREIRTVLGGCFIAASFLLSQLVTPLRIFLLLWGAVFVITSSVGY
ncbi:MAG: YgaP-like transmembrane domain [bacterium]